MKTIIKWGGLGYKDYRNLEDEFGQCEFCLNHEVINYLKIGESIWLYEFVEFVEIIKGGYFETWATIEELKQAIMEICNGPSIVEQITYDLCENHFTKVIHLSRD